MPVPGASSPEALLRMQRQRRRDTKPELAIRRRLHRDGRRYRIDRQVLPGLKLRPDIVFGPAKVAVFVDGCFWHGCPVHGTLPRNNAEWWAAKLARNVDRDRETDRVLAASGWKVVRVWEHVDASEATALIVQTVDDRFSRSAAEDVSRRTR